MARVRTPAVLESLDQRLVDLIQDRPRLMLGLAALIGAEVGVGLGPGGLLSPQDLEWAVSLAVFGLALASVIMARDRLRAGEDLRALRRRELKTHAIGVAESAVVAISSYADGAQQEARYQLALDFPEQVAGAVRRAGEEIGRIPLHELGSPAATEGLRNLLALIDTVIARLQLDRLSRPAYHSSLPSVEALRTDKQRADAILRRIKAALASPPPIDEA